MTKSKQQQRYALLSVWDKTGIVEFAKILVKKNFILIATGGTAQILQKANIPSIPIEKITGNPEAFDGRMKTISFGLESGILFDRSKKNHWQQVKKLGIKPIDLVVCNFYPFEKVAKRTKATVKELTEMIDIGGPTMVRAAAKNYNYVGVVVEPADYQKVAAEIQSTGWLSEKTKASLAVKAYKITANYEAKIHQVLSKKILGRNELRLHLTKGSKLRYGENPHQKGFFYPTEIQDPLSFSNFLKIQGKETSFNNILDIDAAVNALANIEDGQPACVIIKHGNPCGAARAKTIKKAFLQAWLVDPLASFGSIIALNRPLDKKFAKLLLWEERFFEVLLSPEIENTARQMLKKKKNLQVFTNPALVKPRFDSQLDFKKVRSGFLVQEPDMAILKKGDLKVVTQKKPTNDQLKDLLFAWTVCRVCKSNSVVLVKKQTLISTGVGQQDRKRCCQLAVAKAGQRAEGSVAASDAFFPFADGPEILGKAGVKAIIQPGGSIRDADTIKLCNRLGIAMVFTGIRCFRH